MIVLDLSFDHRGCFFFNEYLREAKLLERSQEGEKGSFVYAWAEYYLQLAFWLPGRSGLCYSSALRGQCDISGRYSPALFRTLLRKRGEREGTKVTRLICIQRVFNRRYWAMGMSRPLFVGKEREGYNLVHRVFVPYCACWLDETSDRWSRGTKTLGTRVGRTGNLIADHALGFCPNEREKKYIHRMITRFSS